MEGWENRRLYTFQMWRQKTAERIDKVRNEGALERVIENPSLGGEVSLARDRHVEHILRHTISSHRRMKEQWKGEER